MFRSGSKLLSDSLVYWMWKLDVLMGSKSLIDIFSIITRYEILQVAPGDVDEMSGIFSPYAILWI
jgi:hypothetical protein